MLYCLVSGGNISTPSNLPINYGNISNFYLLETDIIRSYGFYPFIDSEEPAYNEYSQRLEKTLVQVGDHIECVCTIVDLTQEEVSAKISSLQTTLANVIEQFLDQTMQTKGYKSILSACTYANSLVTRNRDEGLAATAWRDAVWAKATEIQTDILMGQRTVPTLPEFIAELPPLVWPE